MMRECFVLAAPVSGPMSYHRFARPTYQTEPLCGWAADPEHAKSLLIWAVRNMQLRHVKCGACLVRIDALMEKYDL